MIVRAAYLIVVLIWSTTPLAIQWSSQGGGYLFGVSARMVIGLCVLYAIFKFARIYFSRSSAAMRVYVLSGLGIYVTMFSVYWGAQFIPSGWIAIVFGLSPIVTGVLVHFLLKEKSFSPLRLLGIACGLTGLLVVFGTSSQFSADALWGVGAVLISTLAHSLSAVLIKRVNAPISGVESTFGGLVLATPLFLTSLLVSGQPVMVEVPTIAWVSIIYLGVVATALGFSLYYYILKYLAAIQVSMITLITPVAALLLGAFLNNEPLTPLILLGTFLVMSGLVLFEFDKIVCRLIRRPSKQCVALLGEEKS